MKTPLKCFLVFTSHPRGVTKTCAYVAVAAEEAEAIDLIQSGYRDFMVQGEAAWIAAEYRAPAADMLGVPAHQQGYTSQISLHFTWTMERVQALDEENGSEDASSKAGFGI